MSAETSKPERMSLQLHGSMVAPIGTDRLLSVHHHIGQIEFLPVIFYFTSHLALPRTNVSMALSVELVCHFVNFHPMLRKPKEVIRSHSHDFASVRKAKMTANDYFKHTVPDGARRTPAPSNQMDQRGDSLSDIMLNQSVNID